MRFLLNAHDPIVHGVSPCSPAPLVNPSCCSTGGPCRARYPRDGISTQGCASCRRRYPDGDSVGLPSLPTLLVFLSLCLLPVWPAVADLGARFVVGFAQDTLDNDWRLAQVDELKRRMAAHPEIEFLVTDGRGSTAQQIQDIEDLISLDVDVLVTSPRDSRAMTPVLSRAYQRGTPVVLLTRRILTDDYTTFIGADDRAIASDAAEYMVRQMNGTGTILMLQGVPTATTAIDRTEAFLDATADYPDIRVITKVGNYLRADAAAAVEELIFQGWRFDAIYAQSDSMVQGALLALEKAAIDPEPLVIVGIDYISEAREAIRAGKQDASFVYPTCSESAARAILAILEGREVPRRITPPSIMVTRDNVDTVEPIF